MQEFLKVHYLLTTSPVIASIRVMMFGEPWGFSKMGIIGRHMTTGYSPKFSENESFIDNWMLFWETRNVNL